MADWWNQPMGRVSQEFESGGSGSGQSGSEAAHCPWCSAVAEPGANQCPNCGAVMAQRESLGGLVIPGVTDVDRGGRTPSLAGSMIRSQARMNMLSAVGHAGGPTVQIAAAAAMLARDSVGGMFETGANAEDVGRPSQAALQMARHLNSTGQDGQAPPSTVVRADEAMPAEPA